MEQKYCQSCGMPLSDEFYASEPDNKKNYEYCMYCYENGEFKQPNLTMEEMIEVCVPFMKEKGMGEGEAKSLMKNVFPNLKRWKRH